jgi:hypothetical protein
MSITPFPFLFYFLILFPLIFLFLIFLIHFSFFFLILFLFSSYLQRKAHARHGSDLIHSSCRGAQARPSADAACHMDLATILHTALAAAQHATSSSACRDPRPAAPRGRDSRPPAPRRRPSRSAPATSPRRTTPPPRRGRRPPDSCASSSTAPLPSSSPPPARLPSPDYSASTARAPSAGLLRLQLHYAAAVELPSAGRILQVEAMARANRLCQTEPGEPRFLAPGRTNDSRERKMRKLPCGSGFGRPFGTDSAPAGHGAGAESVPNTPCTAACSAAAHAPASLQHPSVY